MAKKYIQVKHPSDNPTLFGLLKAGIGVSFPVDDDCSWWLQREGEKIRLTGVGVNLLFDFDRIGLMVALDHIRDVEEAS